MLDIKTRLALPLKAHNVKRALLQKKKKRRKGRARPISKVKGQVQIQNKHWWRFNNQLEVVSHDHDNMVWCTDRTYNNDKIQATQCNFQEEETLGMVVWVQHQPSVSRLDNLVMRLNQLSFSGKLHSGDFTLMKTSIAIHTYSFVLGILRHTFIKILSDILLVHFFLWLQKKLGLGIFVFICVFYLNFS